MVLSGKERQRRWKEQQAAKGRRAVTVNMSQEAYGALQAIKSRTGSNFSKIISSAVTSDTFRYEVTSDAVDYENDRALPHASGSLEPPLVAIVEQRFQGKRKDGLKTQSQIMVTALKLFSEKGYNATSVDDIIMAVGIARRTFYLHFKSKKDILSMIIGKYLQIFNDVIDVVRKSTIHKSQDEIKSVAINGIQLILADVEMRRFTRLMLGEIIGLQETFSAPIDSFVDDVINRVSEAIARVQEDGAISKRVNPTVASFCLVGGIKEILFQQLVCRREFDLAETISLSIDLFADGFFE